MANTPNTTSHSTPGEMKEGEDVPSNLDAARPVIDRIKDIDKAKDASAAGGDTVIDNTPETAAAEEAAKAAEKQAKADEKGARAADRDTDKAAKAAEKDAEKAAREAEKTALFRAKK